MRRQINRNILAAVLLGVTAGSSATGQDITVTAPGERAVGRTNFGAEVLEYSASLVVDVGDLDLSTAEGWKAMHMRLTAASRVACDSIDQHIPIDLRRDRSECERAAYRTGLARARELAKTPSS